MAVAAVTVTGCKKDNNSLPAQDTTSGGGDVPDVQEEYVDLGLPSGTLWCEQNEPNDADTTFGFYDYNAAKAAFGDGMPTVDQLRELKDECQWTWTGTGYSVVGANGNSIFLPAVGYRWYDGTVQQEGVMGNYWSSTQDGQNNAWALVFNADNVSVTNHHRDQGHSVRLVK